MLHRADKKRKRRGTSPFSEGQGAGGEVGERAFLGARFAKEAAALSKEFADFCRESLRKEGAALNPSGPEGERAAVCAAFGYFFAELIYSPKASAYLEAAGSDAFMFAESVLRAWGFERGEKRAYREAVLLLPENKRACSEKSAADLIAALGGKPSPEAPWIVWRIEAMRSEFYKKRFFPAFLRGAVEFAQM